MNRKETIAKRYLRPEDDGTKQCLCLCHSPAEVDWPAWGLVHPEHCSACDGGKLILIPIDPSELGERAGHLAATIDVALNGDTKAPLQPFGFIFITVEIGNPDFHYTSNMDLKSAINFLHNLCGNLEKQIQ